MILALDSTIKPSLLLFAKQSSAMPADIVKSANAALLVASYDYAGIGDVADKVVAGVWYLARASSAKPHVEVNGFHLALEPFRISVITLRQCGGFRNRKFGARVGILGLHLCSSVLDPACAVP